MKREPENAKEVRECLRCRVIVAGSQKAVALDLGISEAAVSAVLTGRRVPYGKILRSLGYRRVVSFEREAV